MSTRKERPVRRENLTPAAVVSTRHTHKLNLKKHYTDGGSSRCGGLWRHLARRPTSETVSSRPATAAEATTTEILNVV